MLSLEEMEKIGNDMRQFERTSGISLEGYDSSATIIEDAYLRNNPEIAAALESVNPWDRMLAVVNAKVSDWTVSTDSKIAEGVISVVTAKERQRSKELNEELKNYISNIDISKDYTIKGSMTVTPMSVNPGSIIKFISINSEISSVCKSGFLKAEPIIKQLIEYIEEMYDNSSYDTDEYKAKVTAVRNKAESLVKSIFKDKSRDGEADVFSLPYPVTPRNSLRVGDSEGLVNSTTMIKLGKSNPVDITLSGRDIKSLSTKLLNRDAEKTLLSVSTQLENLERYLHKKLTIMAGSSLPRAIKMGGFYPRTVGMVLFITHLFIRNIVYSYKAERDLIELIIKSK